MSQNKFSENVLVVGVRMPRMKKGYAEASLDELRFLVDTAGGTVVGEIFQELRKPNPSTLLGKGKVEDLKAEVDRLEISTVVFDDDLTPAQNRNLSEILNAKVLDRTALILDIFAKRAHTKEGKLQVELAQMEYRLPRLKGVGLAMSQQAGYIGNRGPGETKLEVGRRRVRERITSLKKDLAKLRMHRKIQRSVREGVPMPTVALVGYTNAGKSTLINRLTKAEVFVEDKLFATLDPTIRRCRLKSGREILIADTVGFIRRLPHQLVDAFRATFEEVKRADLLLHIIDVSSPDAEEQIVTVDKVLEEFGLEKKDVLKVFNKCDVPVRSVRNDGSFVEISASKGTGLEKLLDEIDQKLLKTFRRVVLQIPYKETRLLDDLYKHGNVIKVKQGPESIQVEVDLSQKYIGKYKRYVGS